MKRRFTQQYSQIKNQPAIARQTNYWDTQKTDLEGVLLGHLDGNDENIKVLRDVVYDAISQELITKTESCIDLGCGGALQLFEHILQPIFDNVDVCDYSREHLKATYKTELDIEKRTPAKLKNGSIRWRLNQEMQNVSFDEQHDLVISRWGLGYLTKDECEAFLLKLNLKLTEGRPKSRPGIAIFQE